MLGHIFYFIGLFVFIISISKSISYFRFIDIKEWFLAYIKVTEKEPEKKDYRSEKEYNLFIGFGCVVLLETFWLICGILSKNWMIFLSLIIIRSILSMIINKLPYSSQKFFGTLIGFIISGIILLLVVNHFHLHLDLVRLMLSSF